MRAQTTGQLVTVHDASRTRFVPSSFPRCGGTPEDFPKVSDHID
ncbi:hypothetical protein ACQPYA_05255 [Micromonospora sp. CA-263727]